MKKIPVYLLLILFLMAFSNSLDAQEAILSSGGDGTGTGGSFSFSFGQFADEQYFEGNSSVAEGVQHPFEWLDVVPEEFTLVNTTVNDEELLCYNATQNITVAGSGGAVTILSGGTTDFVAGNSIRFFYGFHAVSGSYVHGMITTDGTFCDGNGSKSLLVSPPVPDKLAVELSSFKEQIKGIDKHVKVYPNPNDGNFTIELVNFTNQVSIAVYNGLGAVSYRTAHDPLLPASISLPNITRGVYYVKVTGENEQTVKKVIVK